MVRSLELCPDDTKQDSVVYGAKFGVVFLSKGPRTASIQEGLDCLGLNFRSSDLTNCGAPSHIVLRSASVLSPWLTQWRLRRQLSGGDGARPCKILDRHCNAFRRGLRGDPPARVEPLTVTFKPEANMVKAQEHVYSPITTAWLALETW